MTYIQVKKKKQLKNPRIKTNNGKILITKGRRIKRDLKSKKIQCYECCKYRHFQNECKAQRLVQRNQEAPKFA